MGFRLNSPQTIHPNLAKRLEKCGKWCVVRLDDNANEFVMRENLTFEEAQATAKEFEARGHKQVYWARPQ